MTKICLYLSHKHIHIYGNMHMLYTLICSNTTLLISSDTLCELSSAAHLQLCVLYLRIDRIHKLVYLSLCKFLLPWIECNRGRFALKRLLAHWQVNRRASKVAINFFLFTVILSFQSNL